jgi:hypothetical protein
MPLYQSILLAGRWPSQAAHCKGRHKNGVMDLLSSKAKNAWWLAAGLRAYRFTVDVLAGEVTHGFKIALAGRASWKAQRRIWLCVNNSSR